MAYLPNPFLERRSERTTSDLDFVGLFSPKMLERLPDPVMNPGVHVFHSPPGGGKTTLLRAFTPGSLRGFWNARQADDMRETFDWLRERTVVDDEGPQWLGVMLSCAAGYADLPVGAEFAPNGLFRALFDCRTVFRTLRGIGQFLGQDGTDGLKQIELRYDDHAAELKSIPTGVGAGELLAWAEQTERQLYSRLDAFSLTLDARLPTHVRFESLLWLESAHFFRNGREIAPRRLLMVDDLHKLRDSQRDFFVEELTALRSTVPVWLAGRSISFGRRLVSQGGRYGRDFSVHSLDELWTNDRGHQQFPAFAAFVENILDRRLAQQNSIHSRMFRSLVGGDLNDEDIREQLQRGIDQFRVFVAPLREDPQYSEWLQLADSLSQHATYDKVRALYTFRIQIARNQRRPQLRLDLTPLPASELEDRDSSKDERAAEIFMHEELRIPYYFGLDRIATLATFNVEEMLQLAAALYDGLRAKQMLRQRELVLTPAEQEKILIDAARKRFDFIPRTHTQGTRARRLLTGIGDFCRGRTFELNAPYAPGVTGVSLRESDISRLESHTSPFGQVADTLVDVLAECVAENLLVIKQSAATTGREAGLVFYLNRTICAHFGLPVQHGGWQEVEIGDLIDWMQRGAAHGQQNRLAQG